MKFDDNMERDKSGSSMEFLKYLLKYMMVNYMMC